MAQFKVSILLIVVIITLKSNLMLAQSSCSQQDTIFLQCNDFKILVNEKYYLDIEITQENKIKEITKIKRPIFCFYIEKKKYIAKGNELLKSSVPENCDYFYVLDIKDNLVLFDNKLHFIKVVYPE